METYNASTILIDRRRYGRRESPATYFPPLKASSKKPWIRRSAFIGMGLLLGGLIAYLKSRNVVSFWYGPLFQVYSLAAAAYVLSRGLFASFYRPPPDRQILKSVSIIIAVKNEEDHIAETVQRCFEANYPPELLEVMVIDDGSTDGTWTRLEELLNTYPKLRTFRFAKNLGKRHAMALGAEKAYGEILVFMDSDSYLEPEGIYRIVQPFADDDVGAVAGHTLVIIEPDNFISKMEAVRYFVSQRVMKAAESVFGTVSCCPGPFSAYRRSAMMSVLQPWLHQTFLGTPATFGDDRSLTNFILPHYRVLYHAAARCVTYVPRKWSVFFRQQLRWKKSWVRETTIASRFMWKKDALAALFYYVSVIITLFSPLIAFRAMVYLPFVEGSFNWVPYLLGLFLVYAFFGLVYQYHTRSARWYYGFAFALLYVFFMSFQNYYAVLTVRRNHWGTR